MAASAVTDAEILLLDGSTANTIVNNKAVIYGGSGQITGGAGVLTSLSLTDGNLTNVGIVDADQIRPDDAAVGLNINFGGNTTLNKLSLTDNLADALNITEAGNSYLKFVTSNGSESVDVSKYFKVGAGLEFTVAGENAIAIPDNQADALTIKEGGNFYAKFTTSNSGEKITFYQNMEFQDKDLTQIGGLSCDRIYPDAAGVGLDIQFSGDTAKNLITVGDNLAEGLKIMEGSNICLLYTSPSPRDRQKSRMPSSA